jgi:hypothetical protein
VNTQQELGLNRLAGETAPAGAGGMADLKHDRGAAICGGLANLRAGRESMQAGHAHLKKDGVERLFTRQGWGHLAARPAIRCAESRLARPGKGSPSDEAIIHDQNADDMQSPSWALSASGVV